VSGRNEPKELGPDARTQRAESSKWRGLHLLPSSLIYLGKTLKVMSESKPKPERHDKPEPKEKDQAVVVSPKLQDLPVLPVRDTVLFPPAVLPQTVGRDSPIQLL